MTKKRRPTKSKAWRAFEEAVARFAKAIAPDARVVHDARIPDVDTRRSRQRDVWIETDIGGFFPVRILVSCKRLLRTINEQDIDAFVGEIRSSAAHKGVLFAASGFTKPALEKANLLGISCCRLFESQPSKLPTQLTFQAFYCTPMVSFRWKIPPHAESQMETFEDFFKIELEQDGRKFTVATCLAEAVHTFYIEAKGEMTADRALPRDVRRTFGIKDDEKGYADWRLDFALRWRVFKSKLDATLLNGAYSFTEEKFIGEQVTPWLALHEDHPGEGWEELSERPDTSGLAGITVFRGLVESVQLEKLLYEELGPKRLNEIPGPAA